MKGISKVITKQYFQPPLSKQSLKFAEQVFSSEINGAKQYPLYNIHKFADDTRMIYSAERLDKQLYYKDLFNEFRQINRSKHHECSSKVTQPLSGLHKRSCQVQKMRNQTEKSPLKMLLSSGLSKSVKCSNEKEVLKHKLNYEPVSDKLLKSKYLDKKQMFQSTAISADSKIANSPKNDKNGFQLHLINDEPKLNVNQINNTGGTDNELLKLFQKEQTEVPVEAEVLQSKQISINRSNIEKRRQDFKKKRNNCCFGFMRF